MCPYEGFLNDIHGVVAIAGRPDGNRENLPMIAVEQLSEPLRIPGQGALDELPVVLSQFTTSCLTATGRPKFSRLRRGYRLRAATKRNHDSFPEAHGPTPVAPASMDFRPIRSYPDRDVEGNREPRRAFHLFANQRDHLGDLGFGSLENELVVNLQDDAGAASALGEATIDPHHRRFDQIRCGALDRRVDGGALGKLPRSSFRAREVRYESTPTEERRDVAVCSRLVEGGADILGNARVAGEVTVDVVLRLFERDFELLGEPRRAHAVEDAEVDDLRRAALIGADRAGIDSKNLGRGAHVDVLAFPERRDQRRVTREVRQHAALDLRVVGRDQAMAGGRQERRAAAPPLLAPDP